MKRVDAKRLLLVGVDPGKSGGFAIRLPSGRIVLKKMLDTPSDTLLYLQSLSLRFKECERVAIIEKVGKQLREMMPWMKK